MTGDNIAYIYPGAKLALVGKFKSNKMLAGQSANILQATCKDNLVTLKFGVSTVPNSGEGIFAVRDIKAFELLAMYNGYQIVGASELSLHHTNCHNGTRPHNMHKPDELTVRKKCFKNKLNSLFALCWICLHGGILERTTQPLWLI